MTGAGSSRPFSSSDREWVVEAHLRLGMSTHRIARRLGISRHQVVRRLREAGVAVSPRGAGRRRDQRRLPDPANLRSVLDELYVRRRLTSRQIANRLGMSERTVRNRLVECGIPIRSRGRCDRQDRQALPTEEVVELYVWAGLPADQVGQKLGVSGKLVLRTAHDLGLPVRMGGHPDRTGPTEIELIDALYADPLVAGALARHRISHVPPGGPIWQRFPEPVPLTAGLVADLYFGCGVSAIHIELLTGQPAATVLWRLRGAGVPLRPAGGRSPFRRRWASRLASEHERASTGHDPLPDGSGTLASSKNDEI